MSLKELADSIIIDPEHFIGPSSESFVKSIRRIDEMIGLASIKIRIAKRLRNAMKTIERGQKANGFDNIIITGGPGRGKTQLATLIGEAYTALDYFRTPEDKSDINISVPLDEYVKIMMAFNRMCAPKKKLYKYKNKFREQSRRRKVGIALANSCIHKAIFGSLPFLVEGSRKIISDVIDGKYDRSDECPVTDDMENVVKITAIPKKLVMGKCKVFSKGDVVGQYVGQTAPKMIKGLNECLGGVFILDEAYGLLNITKGGGDQRVCSFGIEALNTMNQYASEHEGQLMIILCGYKQLVGALYDVQEGLSRRFGTVFNIDDYDALELVTIYFSKLPPFLRSSDESFLILEVTKLFEGYKFPNQAGDIKNLSKETEVEFDNDKKNPTHLQIEHVSKAFDEIKRQHKEQGIGEVEEVVEYNMYL